MALTLAAVGARAQTFAPPCGGPDPKVLCYASITTGDGTRYSGTLRNGTLEGRGKLSSATIGTLLANFRNGAANGFGKLVTPQGDTYIGFFKDNEYSGEGRLVSADGSKVQEGKWAQGEFKERGPVNTEEWEIRLKAMNLNFDDRVLGRYADLVKGVANTSIELQEGQTACTRHPERGFTSREALACTALRDRFKANPEALTAIDILEHLSGPKVNEDACSIERSSRLVALAKEAERVSMNTTYFHTELARCYLKQSSALHLAFDYLLRANAIAEDPQINALLSDAYWSSGDYVQAREYLLKIPRWSGYHKRAQESLASVDKILEEKKLKAAREAAAEEQRKANYNTPECVRYRQAISQSNKVCAPFYPNLRLNERFTERFMPCQDRAMTSFGYAQRDSTIARTMNAKCSVMTWIE